MVAIGNSHHRLIVNNVLHVSIVLQVLDAIDLWNQLCDVCIASSCVHKMWCS